MLVGLIYTTIFGLILSSKIGAVIGLGIGLATGKYQANKKEQYSWVCLNANWVKLNDF